MRYHHISNNVSAIQSKQEISNNNQLKDSNNFILSDDESEGIDSNEDFDNLYLADTNKINSNECSKPAEKYNSQELRHGSGAMYSQPNSKQKTPPNIDVNNIKNANSL